MLELTRSAIEKLSLQVLYSPRPEERDSGERTMGVSSLLAGLAEDFRPYQQISFTGRPDRPWTGATAYKLGRGLPNAVAH